jgi:mono/diheme cytochrome c family protein
MRIPHISIIAILVGAVAGAALLYSGAYDIGADEPHWPVTARLVETLRERSIAVRARTIEVPALDDAELIAEGAEHYAAMCSECHLGPGVANTEIRAGLYPQPPDLARHVHNHDDGSGLRAVRRQFWIVKHGIKLTAMPAWGATHDDRSIWGIVAFLRKLPRLSVEEYRTLGRTTGSSHGRSSFLNPDAAVDIQRQSAHAGHASTPMVTGDGGASISPVTGNPDPSVQHDEGAEGHEHAH